MAHLLLCHFMSLLCLRICVVVMELALELLVGAIMARSAVVGHYVEHLAARACDLLLLLPTVSRDGSSTTDLIRHCWLLLQPVELVVLQEDRLLHHALVWLREEVVFLYDLVVWAHHLRHVSLQVVSL